MNAIHKNEYFYYEYFIIFHFFRVLYIFTSVRYTIFSTGMGDINFGQENSILQQTDMESNFDD